MLFLTGLLQPTKQGKNPEKERVRDCQKRTKDTNKSIEKENLKDPELAKTKKAILRGKV